jgi:lipoyl(octanoyl) transferase
MDTAEVLDKKNILIQDLGLVDHETAYGQQKAAVAEVQATGREQLLLCEHPAVLTLGRSAKEKNFLLSRKEIEARGIKIISVDRGGDVTLHAPGQLVAYPILDLNKRGRDLKKYLAQLEELVIDFLGSFDILASRLPNRTGAWVDGEKIASIGIGVKKWVSYHGVAVNINTDLSLFSVIKPCGLDVAMTSVAKIKGHSVDFDAAKKIFAETFLKFFQRKYA